MLNEYLALNADGLPSHPISLRTAAVSPSLRREIRDFNNESLQKLVLQCKTSLVSNINSVLPATSQHLHLDKVTHLERINGGLKADDLEQRNDVVGWSIGATGSIQSL